VGESGDTDRGRQIDSGRALAARIELPSDLHDGVAAIEQEPIAVVVRRRRPVDGHLRVELAERNAAPPIDDVEERDPVALARVPRFQNHQVGGELDFARAVSRSLVEIGDDEIALVGRVNCEIQLADNLFVWARGPE
jgi:hypothetical protein